jgi:hypothetical protein
MRGCTAIRLALNGWRPDRPSRLGAARAQERVEFGLIGVPSASLYLSPAGRAPTSPNGRGVVSICCLRLVCSHGFAVSPRISREFCVECPPPEIRGRNATPRGSRECRTLGASAAACAVVESTRVSHHGHAGNVRHSPRHGFNGFLRALPGDRACLPPSLPGNLQEACFPGT